MVVSVIAAEIRVVLAFEIAHIVEGDVGFVAAPAALGSALAPQLRKAGAQMIGHRYL